MGIEDAFTSESMSRRDMLNIPGATTWIERFRHALKMLCRGNEPPIDLCEAWAWHEEIEGESLQDWAVSNAGAYWMSGIGIIEAAEACADTPEEGVGHKLKGE
jgi:hypothetical protein